MLAFCPIKTEKDGEEEVGHVELSDPSVSSCLANRSGYSLYVSAHVDMQSTHMHFGSMRMSRVEQEGELVGDSSFNNNLDAVLTGASEVASTPSSQCVVAWQPRVRCSRAAPFVPYE